MKRAWLCALLFLGALGSCSREPEPPPIDAGKVAELRRNIASCQENEWRGCAGAFIRSDDGTVIQQLILTDNGNVVGNETPSFNEITVTQLQERASGENGDRYLNNVSIIWPSDAALWNAAAVEHARLRLQQ